MTDSEFLNWLGDRLVHVYGESENVDFVLKVRRLAKEASKPEIASGETVDYKPSLQCTCGAEWECGQFGWEMVAAPHTKEAGKGARDPDAACAPCGLCHQLDGHALNCPNSPSESVAQPGEKAHPGRTPPDYKILNEVAAQALAMRVERLADPMPQSEGETSGCMANEAAYGEAGNPVIDELTDFVVSRWHAEVKNRPLVNKNRRSLDDAWRQILRHLGVDDRARLGPTHDELLEGFE